MQRGVGVCAKLEPRRRSDGLTAAIHLGRIAAGRVDSVAVNHGTDRAHVLKRAPAHPNVPGGNDKNKLKIQKK